MTRRRLDDPKVKEACEHAGCLVAQRILALEDVATSIATALLQGGYRGDVMGMETRIVWAVRESADAWQRRRDKTEWDIRRGIQSLLDAWEDWRVILAQAETINREAGSPLLRPEVSETVKEAMRAHIRRTEAQKKGRRHAR